MQLLWLFKTILAFFLKRLWGDWGAQPVSGRKECFINKEQWETKEKVTSWASGTAPAALCRAAFSQACFNTCDWEVCNLKAGPELNPTKTNVGFPLIPGSLDRGQGGEDKGSSFKNAAQKVLVLCSNNHCWDFKAMSWSLPGCWGCPGFDNGHNLDFPLWNTLRQFMLIKIIIKIITWKHPAATERKLCSFPSNTLDNVSLAKENLITFLITIWRNFQLRALLENTQTPRIGGLG